MSIDGSLSGMLIIFGFVLIIVVLAVIIRRMGIMGSMMAKVCEELEVSGEKALGLTGNSSKKATAASWNNAGISGETVAAISTAIYAYMSEVSEPGIIYEIKSIKRVTVDRPVWGLAGMLQNTRPF